MRRAALVGLMLLVPAMAAQAVSVRVAVFVRAGSGEKAAVPDHVTERSWPTDLSALWDAIGPVGIELRTVDTFSLNAEEKHDSANVHTLLQRVGGSKARVNVTIDGVGEPFSLPIPFGGTVVIASADAAPDAEWVAISVFTDAKPMPQVLRVGGEVVAPKRLSGPEPLYPDDVRKQGAQGIVILEVIVDESGNVVAPHILKPLPGLNESALTAVRAWKFSPATRDGKPVSALFNLTIQFKLK